MSAGEAAKPVERLNEGGLDAPVPHRRRRRRALELIVAGVPLLIFVLAAVVGPLVVRYDPITTRTGERLKPPGAVLGDGSLALLGTDQVGRDLLAQVLQGARI
jgi:peptide/nickel transport system permease protein